VPAGKGLLWPLLNGIEAINVDALPPTICGWIWSDQRVNSTRLFFPVPLLVNPDPPPSDHRDRFQVAAADGFTEHALEFAELLR